MKLKILLVGALFMLPVTAFANDTPKIDTEAGTFVEQRARVESDLADGKTYAEISAQDRSAVVRALDEIETALGERPVSELRGSELTKVMNAQALINNKLTQAGEDSRVICRREASVGTRLARSQCLTVAQRRRAREDAQEVLSQNRNMIEDFRGQ